MEGVYPDTSSSWKHMVGKKTPKNSNPVILRVLVFSPASSPLPRHYQKAYFPLLPRVQCVSRLINYKSISPTVVKHNLLSPTACWLTNIWISVHIHTCTPLYKYIHKMTAIFIYLPPGKKPSKPTK